MRRTWQSEVDVTTTADLPELRESMISYAEDDCFSSALRTTCLDVVAAIDEIRGTDVSTHQALRTALLQFVVVGQREALLHADCQEMLPC